MDKTDICVVGFGFGFARDPNKKGVHFNKYLIAAFALAFILSGHPSLAQTNLLVNPGFENGPYGHQPYGQPVTSGWTYYSPPPPTNYFGDYWVDDVTNVPHSGLFYWKEWGALYLPTNNNVAGIYQTFSSLPGSTYQASGWFYTSAGDTMGAACATWIQVEFLNSSSNLLALYKSPNFTSSMLPLSTWYQLQANGACDLTQSNSTGDPYFTTYAVTGTVSQLVAPPGTAWVRYRYAFLQATNEGGSSYLDDTVLNQTGGSVPPTIANIYPQNMIFVNPTNTFSFTASSPSGNTINNSGIHLYLNGTDVSAGLTFSGSASSKTAIYSGLQSNTAYNVSITVTDSVNLAASQSTYFETMWVGVPPITYIWEAEDWDFSGGMFVPGTPDLCNAPGDPNCYFGKVGTEGVDEHNVSVGPNHFYRPNDKEGTAPSGDYTRPNLFAADRLDYALNPFNSAEWVNYTRIWPASTNWVIARLSTDLGLSGSITLSVVTSSSTNDLGTFSINGGKGWTTFMDVYLLDTNGNKVIVVLNGQEKLRATSGGNLLPTFYMLTPAIPDLPLLTGMNPTGRHPFEPTNALTFRVTTLGATLPLSGIKVNLDGIDVSSRLVVTGSTSSNNVVYPTLQTNTVHTAIITVTNSLGHGIIVTNQFDTFTQGNYMFEAEDYDFGGGQYIPSSQWTPDAYAPESSVSGIDFVHTQLAGEPAQDHAYRVNGIPQELVTDFIRQEFIGNFDYHLYWYGPGDWANYTRDYPPGSYYVYVRTAGLGLFNMNLDQVIAGTGTTNQTTQHVGQWQASGNGIQTNAWVLLTDGGLVAPVVVRLGGVPTLRVTTTTGNCYPNYFMLVPAFGAHLSAAVSANNFNISFPTQTGFTYRVFYRTNLVAGNWTLLTTVLGNGSVMTVTDSTAASSQRFYEVTSP
jgi:hypothetical protein